MPENSHEVNALPTKALFIDFLTKDLSLNRAVTDLVDNSIDGARRLRPGGDYTDLYVNLTLTPSHFEIVDNCGGIPVDIARNYAFRFGRPAGMAATPHSVGQFGVGMKRALFKLGKFFRVTSVADTSQFVLPVDVEEWRGKDEWRFEFAEVEENISNPESARKTTIRVEQLLPGVATEFRLQNFATRLANELQAAHQESIASGLTIRVNGLALEATTIKLRDSGYIETGFRLVEYGEGQQKVTVRIYTGVGDSSPGAAGWYVFCNGRLLLEADQTSTTGWGEAGETRVPKYHNQFAAFRGLVYFDSEDATRLPWNTTKTGVDDESPIYRSVKEEILLMMRPVIDFLNELDREKSGPAEDRPLARALEETNLVLPRTLTQQRPFKAVARRSVVPAGPRMQRIQYDRPVELVDKVKANLGVSSYKDVGGQTFDYYYKMECEE